MKKIVMLASLVATLALAQIAWASLDDKKFSGNLIDAACGNKNKEHSAKIAGHPKSCALMEACVKSGYGIVTAEGKFIKFDENGDKLALALLKGTKTEKNIQVEVSGTQEGDILKVTDITEKAAQKEGAKT